MKTTVKTLVVALMALSTGNLFAGDYTWSAAVDGRVSDETKWTPQGVPGSGDTVTFDKAGTYCVTESADRSLASAFVTNAEVTVDLGGKTWTVAGPWSTYNSTTDTGKTSTTISNGTLDVQHGTSTAASGIILSLKQSTTTKGSLWITGANTSVKTKALWMGGTKGSFVLDGGASCDVAGEVVWGGHGAGGSDNTVSITGAGTRFRQSAAGAQTGNNIGDRNKYYFADGADVYFTTLYYLSGGYGGRWNELWITNGASVVFGNGLWVAASANGRKVHQNVCTIAGADTRVTVTGALTVATSAVSNRLHITDHAIVTHTVGTGSTTTYLGWDNGNGGNEFRVDGGAEYHCLPSPTASYHYLSFGQGVNCAGNRIFVGADSLFEIARQNNDAKIGYDGAHDNGIVVSNGTFDVTTSWPMYFGTSKDASTACGSGNYVEFYGDHPLAYMGTLTFNTGSKLIYHIGSAGYAAAPMNFRYKATNTSAVPAQLVLDVAEWCPEKKTTIPLAVTMRDADVTNNKILLQELMAHASIEGAKHPEWYSLSLSADDKTLQLTCKPARGLVLILR